MKNKKGETMGIRKFISLLLLVAFALQLSPAYAASFDNAGATLPTIVQDSGTKANGANRDVVPVVIRVNNIASGELNFSRLNKSDTAGVSNVTVSVGSNGQLAFTNDNGSASIVTRYAIVLTAPTGTQFVGLPTDGYVSTLSSAVVNGLTATPQTVNVALGGGATDSVLPGGTADTNGNFFLAGVLTGNGPAAYFGSIIPKGSIVVHPVTYVTTGGTNTSSISFQLSGFGLVANPAGDNSLTGTLSGTNVPPSGGTVDAALTTVVSNSVSLATVGTVTAGKLETASLTNEPDNQANTVLASRLATGSSTINIGPGLVTSTGTGLTALNVDTDAIIIRATERTDSTTGTPTYHQTPFATSAFVPGQALTANGSTSIAVLNTALTDTTKFPNTANALITVTFKAVNPADGTDSDAILVVDAVALSLFGQRAFNKVRNLTANQTATLANGGYLGVLALGTNGATATKAQFGVGVLYNGNSAISALVVKDASPANYTDQTAKVGILAASNLTVPKPSANAPTSIANGSTAAGIFPGSLVTDIANGDDASVWDLVATANGSGSTPFSFTLNGGAAFAAAVNNGAIYTPGEITGRLVTGATNAWFTILGNETGTDIGNGRDLTVGASNLSSVLPNKAPQINASLGVRNAANNAVLAANLTAKVLTILPISNRYDSLRDAIAIRPSMTLTLGTNSRTQGVKIVAVITGGNIGTSEEVVVANVLAAGSLSTNFRLQTVPVAGNMTSLMVENGSFAGNGRALIALSSITGASTTTDALSDLLGTLALDNTMPPLFCGGTAGAGKKGPNGVVFQPKGRTILITENGTDQFKAIDDLGTARIRVTLPSGWDLNAYNGSLASSQILGVMSTGNGSTFTSAPVIARVQPRNVNTGSSTTDNAFIDIDVGTPGTTTQAVNRIIGLVFKPNALIAPVGTTSFDATVAVVDVGSTNTRGATIADDTILATLGTASLGSACSSFLSLSYCDDAVSSYQATGSFGTVASARLEQAAAIANGANLSSFSAAPTSAIRLIANTTAAVALPDLCIEEGIADALPIGQGVDGIPDAFGISAVTTNGTGLLHIASSFQGTDDVGLSIGGTPTVLVSDNTVTVITADPAGAANEVSFTVAEGSATGRDRPFQAKTQFRVRGLQADGATAGTVPPAQDFVAWFEAVAGAGDYAVGSSLPMSVRKDTVNGNSLVGISTGSAEDVKMAANFLNGDTADGSATVTDISTADTSTAANNDLSILFGTATNAPKLTNAVINQVDDSTFNVLNADTTISVSVGAITGSTDKLVEVSGGAGSLEPGSTLTISSTGTGPSDSVFIPVLPNGSFKGVIRASTSQTITVIQTPDSADTGVPPQIRSLDVEDQNVDPTITAAVVQDIGLGTVSEKGKVPVVFEVTATGKSGGLDFVPTASQLTLGGEAVTAVAGSTTQFIGLVDFAQSDALTVVCTSGSDVSSVDLSSLDSDAPTKGGAPSLVSVKNNTGGFVVLKGKRLRNGETFGFVLDDGTFQAVTLGTQTKTQKKKFARKSSAAEDIPANAVFGVFSSPDRGVSSVEPTL